MALCIRRLPIQVPRTVGSLEVDSLGCVAQGECWVGIKPQMKPASENIMIYPNPAEQQANFKLRITNYEVRLRIRLFDLFGREVKNVTLFPGQTKYRLDVSDLPAGLYIAVVESGEKIIGREKLAVE